MINQFIFLSLLFVPGADNKPNQEFRDAIQKEIDEGSIIGRKPTLDQKPNTLVVDLGEATVIGLSEKGKILFRPVQQQLQVDLIRNALLTPQDKTAAAPLLAEIEKEIDSQLELIRSPTISDEKRKSAIEAHDLKIAELRTKAFEAVARARGLQRVQYKKPAHEPWKVKLISPKGTSVRYTPYLNFLLNEKSPEKIDWLTAQNGDTLKMRGRYRVELLLGNRVISFRQLSIADDSSIEFDQSVGEPK